MTATPEHPPWPAAVLAKAARLELLALDVDGVMTDGRLLFGAGGDELKAFHTLDGLGLKQLMAAGVTVAVITGRSSPLTRRRMTDLGIRHLLQGRDDKKTALLEIAASLELEPEQLGYIGDDLPDLGAIRYAGLGVTVPNGHWFVRQQADYCTRAGGGEGAVRELTDLILSARGQLDPLLTAALEAE